MMPADGVASRPASTRQRSRKAVMIRSHTPSLRKQAKYEYTVDFGGYSRGIMRQAQPAQSHVKDPVEDCPHLDLSWPSAWLRHRGMSGERMAHSSSVRSDGYSSIGVPTFSG